MHQRQDHLVHSRSSIFYGGGFLKRKDRRVSLFHKLLVGTSYFYAFEEGIPKRVGIQDLQNQ